MHLPSFWHTLNQDLHDDSLIAPPLEALPPVAEENFREQSKWPRAHCQWDLQLSLLVALALPRGGATLYAYDWSGDGPACDDYRTAPAACFRRRTFTHKLGHAILLESQRAHAIGNGKEADGIEPRMVVHAFLIPCWRNSSKGELAYLMLGPLGR